MENVENTETNEKEKKEVNQEASIKETSVPKRRQSTDPKNVIEKKKKEIFNRQKNIENKRAAIEKMTAELKIEEQELLQKKNELIIEIVYMQNLEDIILTKDLIELKKNDLTANLYDKLAEEQRKMV